MAEIKLRPQAYREWGLNIAEMQKILDLYDVEIGTIDIDDNSVTWDKLAVAVQNSFLKLSGGILTGQLISDDISDILGNILLRHKTPDELHMSSLKISAYTDDNDTYGENVINSYGGNLCLWAKSVLGVRITDISDGFELDSGGFHFYESIGLIDGKTVDGVDVSEIPNTYLPLVGGTLTGNTTISKTNPYFNLEGSGTAFIKSSALPIQIVAENIIHFLLSDNWTVTYQPLRPMNTVTDIGSVSYQYRDGYFNGNLIVGGNVDGVDVSAIPATYFPLAGGIITGNVIIQKDIPAIRLFDNAESRFVEIRSDGAIAAMDTDCDEWHFYKIISDTQDIFVITSSKGFCFKDRVTGAYRRIVSSSGVLSTEAV